MDKTLIIVILAFCIALGVGLWVSNRPEQVLEKNFMVGYETEIDENWLGLDEFFFADSLYHGLFFPLNLIDEMSIGAKAEVLGEILNNLSYESPVFFQVENYQGNDTLIVFFELHKAENGDIYLIEGTNFNVLTEKLIRRSRDIGKTLMVVYHINDGKLINHFYMENPTELEKQIRNANNLNNLADFYLMDTNPENDQYIEELCLQYQEEAEDIFSRFISYLTLAEYYGSLEDDYMFRITLSDAEQLAFDNPEIKAKNGLQHLKMIEEVYEISKFLKRPRD